MPSRSVDVTYGDLPYIGWRGVDLLSTSTAREDQGDGARDAQPLELAG
jgi:hypothetical protein